MRTHWCLPLGVGLLFAGCGGLAHDGYKTRTQKPWKKPKVLEFTDEDGDKEAEDDGTVNYAQRKRARWYAIDLPTFGSVKVRVTAEPFEGDKGALDLAFEILDSGYRVIERADRDEDDAGDLSKKRTLEKLDSGRYYIHIYLQDYEARADYDLRVSFTPGLKKYKSSFPSEVPYVGVLPAVPLFDDTPTKPRPRVRVTRRRDPKSPSVRGRISGITSTPKGTRIKIDRGSDAGVTKGWRGVVITSSGKAIQNGAFTVSKVSASEAYGMVRATQDAVTAAKYVRLSPPAK